MRVFKVAVFVCLEAENEEDAAEQGLDIIKEEFLSSGNVYQVEVMELHEEKEGD